MGYPHPGIPSHIHPLKKCDLTLKHPETSPNILKHPETLKHFSTHHFLDASPSSPCNISKNFIEIFVKSETLHRCDALRKTALHGRLNKRLGRCNEVSWPFRGSSSHPVE